MSLDPDANKKTMDRYVAPANSMNTMVPFSSLGIFHDLPTNKLHGYQTFVLIEFTMKQIAIIGSHKKIIFEDVGNGLERRSNPNNGSVHDDVHVMFSIYSLIYV
jgi:hypothetical protein